MLQAILAETLEVRNTRLQPDQGEGVGRFRVRGPSLRCFLGGVIKGLQPFWLLSLGVFCPSGGREGGLSSPGRSPACSRTPPLGR